MGQVLEDGHTGFQIWMLDICCQAGIEAADHPLFQGIQFGWRAVTGNDDLLVGFFQGVEGVEKFLLGGFLVPQELDIVDEQHVDIPIFLPKGFQPIMFYAFDQFIGESFAGNIQHFHFRMVLQDLVADGIHQMGLAQAGIAE